MVLYKNVTRCDANFGINRLNVLARCTFINCATSLAGKGAEIDDSVAPFALRQVQQRVGQEVHAGTCYGGVGHEPMLLENRSPAS